MKARASLLLALRFLIGGREAKKRGRRIRGGIIGVGLSLVPLVVVLQVTDGMIAGITSRFIEAGSYHIQAISRADPSLEDVNAIAQELAAIDGVTLAAREKQGLGLAGSSQDRTGVTIRAVEPGLWGDDAALRDYLEFTAGRWDLSADNSILLGTEVAERLGVAVGDSVSIVVARPISAGRFLPRTATFIVRGVFTSGYQDLDRLWVFIPFERGFTLLPDSISRQVIGLKIGDPLALPNPLYRPLPGRTSLTRDDAQRILTDARDIGGINWRTATWFELERSKYMSFKTTKNLLVFIMVLIVLVAAVNISSTLVMLVLDKQEEIAILKSLGASPAGMRRLFLTAGLILGTLGTIAGMSVGLLFALGINQVLYAIEWVLNAVVSVGIWIARPVADLSRPAIELLSADFYLESIPFALRGSDLLLIAVLSISLSTAAAFFPARRAVRLQPLEILQKR